MPFENDDAARPAPTRSDAAGVQEQIWLLGQPPLRDYLDFVKRHVVGGEAMDPREVVDAWRAANDHYAELEAAEAGLADEAELLDLPDALAPLAAELTARPHFRRTFDRVPTQVAMVELDKLVVSQRHVVAPFVEALRARLDPASGPEDVFRFCQPLDRRDPPVAIRRIGGQRFAFMSESTDLRFHEAALMAPGQVCGYETFGPIAGVVGLVVGYGSNFLSAIRSDDRMVLHNGYHRAYALRAAGVTHAPCVVQTVTRRDELEITATQVVADDPAFYFRAKRPPLLKDFFDPKIRTVLPVRRTRKMIEVNFEIREYDVPED